MKCKRSNKTGFLTKKYFLTAKNIKESESKGFVMQGQKGLLLLTFRGESTTVYTMLSSKSKLLIITSRP
jgi:hypothetical protein